MRELKEEKEEKEEEQPEKYKESTDEAPSEKEFTANVIGEKEVEKISRDIVVEVKKLLKPEEVEFSYDEYFNYIRLLRDEEYKCLKYWVDLYAIKFDPHQTNAGEYNIIEKRSNYHDIKHEPLIFKEQVKRKSKEVIKIVEECVADGNNAIFFGDSGAGKSFTCVKLFEEYRKEYCASDSNQNDRIPLFAELSEINKEKYKTKDIEDVIKGKIDKKQFAKDINKYTIFLDALNEVRGFRKQELVFQQIVTFARLNPETMIFVTTQTTSISFADVGNFLLYEIQKFKDNDVIDYLENNDDKFETREEAEKFYNDLNRSIRDLISNPQFLKMLTISYEKDEDTEISSIGQLLQEYAKWLCGLRESRDPMDEECRLDFLPFLAFKMCENNESRIKFVRFNEYVQDSNLTIPARKLRKILTISYKILRKCRDAELEFIHDTLKYYFAAVYMLNKEVIIEDEFNPENIVNYIIDNRNVNGDIISSVGFLLKTVNIKIAKSIINKCLEKNLNMNDKFTIFILCRDASIHDYDELFHNWFNEALKDVEVRYYGKWIIKPPDIKEIAGVLSKFEQSVGPNHHYYQLCLQHLKYPLNNLW